jgi:hypothetical protein
VTRDTQAWSRSDVWFLEWQPERLNEVRHGLSSSCRLSDNTRSGSLFSHCNRVNSKSLPIKSCAHFLSLLGALIGRYCTSFVRTFLGVCREMWFADVFSLNDDKQKSILKSSIISKQILE